MTKILAQLTTLQSSVYELASRFVEFRELPWRNLISYQGRIIVIDLGKWSLELGYRHQERTSKLAAQLIKDFKLIHNRYDMAAQNFLD